MNLQKIIPALIAVVLFVAAWRAYGWGGLAVVSGGLVMWALLHFTRVTQVLSRSANRPVGYVGSAVMLNAKLKPGVNLLHVLAMTEALGERLSAEGAQPEVYRWTDGGASSVTAEFSRGKLVKWTLMRPPTPEGPDDGPGSAGK